MHTDPNPEGEPASATGADAAEALHRRAAMNEQQRRYRDMRGVLEDLVNAWPAGHVGAVYQAVIIYLHTHTARVAERR